MIAILKNGTTQEQKDHLIQWLKRQDLDVHVSEGTQVTILGLVVFALILRSKVKRQHSAAALKEAEKK